MSRAGSSPADDPPRRTRKTSQAGRPAEPTRIVGRVDHVRGGPCLHLEADGVIYELIGAPTGLVVGGYSTITGHVDRTVSSACGRGIPFVVTAASPHPDSGR